ncbi:hypothetical protein ONZ45_g2476 [Pleurotus djamor]|nr:hypothetical protein ONZ45_g2476 [Pleurotus djamor]
MQDEGLYLLRDGQALRGRNTAPYGPTSFLTTTWRTSPELAGYAQRDAHEFFISALNQIHSTSRGSTNVSCNCIIHSTFAGLLQSDVKYTQPEKLGAKEYTCDKCGKAGQEASKRLSVKKLPPVLSFQFKRFEQKSIDKTSARKIDTPIRFPATLNMAPYTTASMRQTDKENTPSTMTIGPDTMYDYDLFAVINHEGQIDNGHYTSYARYQDEVPSAESGIVLMMITYMCFYVKRHLEYKPHMTPTYVKTRESEAVKEKMEMEKEKEKEKEKEHEKEKEKEQEQEAARMMKEVDDALLAFV